jgi:hypothetical protein
MFEPRGIGDEEHVSQYGSRENGEPVFWDTPRPEDTDGALSVLLGKVTPEEARRAVRRSHGAMSSADGVRYARAGELRAQGFEVVHTPRRENPGHASVRLAGVWGNQAAGKFNSCFCEVKWHGEPEKEDSDE